MFDNLLKFLEKKCDFSVNGGEVVINYYYETITAYVYRFMKHEDYKFTFAEFEEGLKDTGVIK